MKGELIFVPLIGSTAVPDWRKIPHIKAWGLWDGDDLHLLYVEMIGEVDVVDLSRTQLFAAEKDLIQVIEHGSTTVPEQVSVRLAQLTITGDFLS